MIAYDCQNSAEFDDLIPNFFRPAGAIDPDSEESKEEQAAAAALVAEEKKNEEMRSFQSLSSKEKEKIYFAADHV